MTAIKSMEFGLSHNFIKLTNFITSYLTVKDHEKTCFLKPKHEKLVGEKKMCGEYSMI